MKTYAIVKGLTQNYGAYTHEDELVWKTLFERQMNQLNKVADQQYLEGLNRIGFSPDKIPNFKIVNERLAELTGWEIVVVPGIIDQATFFKMLANKKFPSSTWLRKMEDLDYLSEPDMFHDAFGHIPLLTNQTFCDFYRELGNVGVNYINKPDVIERLGRIYWFTVEFGLIRNNKEIKIYGAGILSSIGETKFSLSKVPKRKRFDILEIMDTDFDNSKIQDLYFVIESFDELLSSIRNAIKEKRFLSANQFE
jgi:phenylalanine-4-hydroxylase